IVARQPARLAGGPGANRFQPLVAGNRGERTALLVGEAARRVEAARELVGVAFVEAVEIVLHRGLDGANVLVHGCSAIAPERRRALAIVGRLERERRSRR